MGTRIDDLVSEAPGGDIHSVTDGMDIDVKAKAQKATQGIRGMVSHAKENFAGASGMQRAGIIAGNAASVGVGVHGAHNIVQGVKEGDMSEVAIGAAEVGAAGLGVAYSNGFKPHQSVMNAVKKFRGR